MIFITTLKDIPHTNKIESVSMHLEKLLSVKFLKEYFEETTKTYFTKIHSLNWVHLNESETISLHDHDTHSLVIILYGAGVLNGEHKNYVINKDDIVFLPSKTLHGFSNISKEGLTLLAIAVS